ncbi:MAG: hypothetical protein FWD30_02095 [Dehalococcoidia bacterium]|nr:hypothetical protein [Dehalococcoidia bacterium]
MVLYIAVAIGGEFGFLYHVNAPNPASSEYVNTFSSDTAEIRQRMLDFGLPEYVLNDLPESEILLFSGIYDGNAEIKNSHQIVWRDDGKLEVVGFEGLLPGGKVRTLFYYRWLELPKHTFVDLIAIQKDLRYFALPNDINESGLALYDKDGKTYGQTLQYERGATHYAYGLVQVKFRLYPHYENQRAYVAMDTVISRLSVTLSFDSFSSYVHQEHLWNRPHLDISDIVAASIFNDIRISTTGSVIFCREVFITSSPYRPMQVDDY